MALNVYKGTLELQTVYSYISTAIEKMWISFSTSVSKSAFALSTLMRIRDLARNERISSSKSLQLMWKWSMMFCAVRFAICVC